MKISTTISKLILLALLLIPEFVLAQNQTIDVNGTQIQISSTLQTVLDQAESVYIPSGFTMDAIYKDAPDMAPLFLGLIMQRQEIYMNQIRNVNHLKNNTSLRDEIATFIGQLAKAHNYINPVDDSKMSPITMHKDFKNALKGDYNNLYTNKFGINPTTANIAYLLDRAPNNNNVTANTDDYAKVQLQDEENDSEHVNEINLFGTPVIGGANPQQDIAISGNAGKTGLFKADKHICPDKAPVGPKYYDEYGAVRYFVIKQGGKWDNTGTKCSYTNGLLKSQYPYIKGNRHGLHLSYRGTKDGKRYLESQGYYAYGKVYGVSVSNKEYPYQGNRLGKSGSSTSVNGQSHGPFKEWYMTKSGINYIKKEGNYKNDKLHGILKEYYPPSMTWKKYLRELSSYSNGIRQNRKSYRVLETGKHYLEEDFKFIDGKPQESIRYHSSGGIQAKTSYINGDYSQQTLKCWHKSGEEMEIGDIVYYGNVDWMNTDWCEDKKTCDIHIFDN